MKNIELLSKLSIVVLFLSLVSCGQDDEQTAFLDESEAAEDIAATLSSDLVALTGDIQDLSEGISSGRSLGLVELCGVSYDTTVVKEYTGQYVSASLSITMAMK